MHEPEGFYNPFMNVLCWQLKYTEAEMDSIIEKEEADEREKVRQEVCACVKITVCRYT
jgi:hypothetical protein